MLPFASSRPYEYGFSALIEIKSKKRERLVELTMKRICFLMTEPRFDLIGCLKQAYPSH